LSAPLPPPGSLSQRSPQAQRNLATGRCAVGPAL